jgi:hypothetical protein
MSNKNSTAFLGSYDTVDAATTDLDAVNELHHSGGVGHVEVAIVSRDDIGKLTWNRHERLGGIHLSHAPSEELTRLSDQLEAASVTLVVIGSVDDAAAAEHAATHAGERTTKAVEHPSLAEGYFSGGGGADPGGQTGFEDGSVGHLGV